MHLKKFILITGFTIIVGVIGISIYTSILGKARRNEILTHAPTNSFSTEAKYLKTLFGAIETKGAYAHFKKLYTKSNPAFAHNLAHVVGSLLYDRYKANGISYCTDDFESGCFHGLVSKSIMDHQSASDRLCDTVPKTKITDCIHGVGHGIMGMHEYDVNGINTSLESCESLNEHTQACSDGVMMEYNTGISAQIRSGKDIRVTPLQKNVYEPCVSLLSKYQATCFLDIAPRWHAYITEDFEKIIEMCEAVSNIQNKLACFRGIARVTPNGKMQSDVISDVCKRITNPDGRQVCLDEIASQK